MKCAALEYIKKQANDSQPTGVIKEPPNLDVRIADAPERTQKPRWGVAETSVKWTRGKIETEVSTENPIYVDSRALRSGDTTETGGSC